MKRIIIGITGNFGSGKTTIANIFSRYGYKVINADDIGHELYKNKKVRNIIIKKFGKKILTNNKIDRRKLKDIIFYDYRELQKLNRIMWPLIKRTIIKIIKKNKSKKIIVEGALIIEAKWADIFDKLIVIKINKKEQLKRILKKRKYNKKEVNNILKSQLPQKKKLKYADYIIDNTKPLGETKKQVKALISKWQK